MRYFGVKYDISKPLASLNLDISVDRIEFEIRPTFAPIPRDENLVLSVR